MAFDFKNPFGLVQSQPSLNLPTGLIQTSPQKKLNPMAGDKNDKLALMLHALGGALRGDQGYIQNTLQLQQMQENKRKEAKRRADIEAFLNTPEGSRYKEAYKLKDLLGIDISKFSKSGNDGTSLMQNTAALAEKRKRYANMTEEEKKSKDGVLLLQEINDFAGLGGALKYDAFTEYEKSRAGEAGKQGVSFSDGPLTEGQLATDRGIATFYKDYVSKGRSAKNVANVERLDDAKAILKYAAQNGIPISSVPYSLVAQRPTLSAFFSPEGVMAQERVASVIQQSLKEILGGQFAEREGIALIQRGYNPALNPEENLERLLDLEAQVLQIVESEQDMVEYYENNNMSMAGYKGKRYTADDFVRDLKTEYTIDVRKLSEEELEDAFLEANDDSLWENTIENEIKRRLKKKK